MPYKVFQGNTMLVGHNDGERAARWEFIVFMTLPDSASADEINVLAIRGVRLTREGAEELRDLLNRALIARDAEGGAA